MVEEKARLLADGKTEAEIENMPFSRMARRVRRSVRKADVLAAKLRCKSPSCMLPTAILQAVGAAFGARKLVQLIELM